MIILIVINFALWIANGFFTSGVPDDNFFANNGLTKSLSLRQNLSPQEEPQQKKFFDLTSCYRFLTYGFAHSPYTSPYTWTHIVFNMIGLLMFGYGMMLGIGPGGFGFVRGENVEGRLGRLEFTAFYLLTIIVGGVVFALMNINEPRAGCLGASGGVCGVIILYAWLYPRKTLLLYGILPLPMWVLGGLIVFMDAAGAVGHWGSGIAYSVHLAGAACGTLYYFVFLKQGRSLTDWLAASTTPSQRTWKVRVHMPENESQRVSSKEPLTSEEEFSRRLDEILKRYGEVGEAGLTAEQREFLKQASRKFAEKHSSNRGKF